MFKLRPERSPDIPYGLWVCHFRVCPLCDALSPVQNDECFVCRWHGAFEENPAVVEMAIRSLLAECPQVAKLLAPPAEPPPWWKRWLGLAPRRRGIDLRV